MNEYNGPCSTIVMPTIKFDGHVFSCMPSATVATCLYLAREARDGNEVAAEALNACDVVITDVDGKYYWPKS